MKQLGRFVTSKALEDRFAKYGPILSSKVVLDGDHRSLGYGFVIFEHLESAEKARQGEFASKWYGALSDPKCLQNSRGILNSRSKLNPTKDSDD